MDYNHFKNCVIEFKKFIDEDLVEIEWGQNSQGLMLSDSAKTRVEKSTYFTTEENFVDIAFDIIYISIALSTGKVISNEFDAEKVNIVKKHFISQKLLDKIHIKTSSSYRVLENIDYEILTKRNKNNPTEIITHTILLNIITTSPQLTIKDNKPLQKLNIELTENELSSLIDILSKALIDMESIGG